MIYHLTNPNVFFKVYAEELKGGNEVVQLTFRATNLDKKVQKCSIMLFQQLEMICMHAHYAHYVYNVFIGSLHKPKSYSVAVVV